MQRLEVSGAVRPIYGSLGVKRLINYCLLTGYHCYHVYTYSLAATVVRKNHKCSALRIFPYLILLVFGNCVSKIGPNLYKVKIPNTIYGTPCT